VTSPAGGKAPSIEILTIPAAAALLGLTAKALRLRIGRGEFPSRTLGRRRMILRRDLEAFLDGLPGVSVKSALAAVTANGVKP
jgi:hypothetical protein